MKSFVCVFRQSQACEKSRRLLRDWIWLIGYLAIRHRRCRFQILLGVRRREERKFTGQAIFEKKTCDLARVIHFGQCKARQSQARRRYRSCNPPFCFTPPFEEFLSNSLVAASSSNLVRHQLSIVFDRANDFSQRTHRSIRFLPEKSVSKS